MLDSLSIDARQRAVQVLKYLPHLLPPDDSNRRLQIAIETGHFTPAEFKIIMRHLLPKPMAHFSIFSPQPYFFLIKSLIANKALSAKLLTQLFLKFALIFDFPPEKLKSIPIEIQKTAIKAYLQTPQASSPKRHFFYLPASFYLALLKGMAQVPESQKSKFLTLIVTGLCQTPKHTANTLTNTIIRLPTITKNMPLAQLADLITAFLNQPRLTAEHLFILWPFIKSLGQDSLLQSWLQHPQLADINVLQAIYETGSPHALMHRKAPKELFQKIQ